MKVKSSLSCDPRKGDKYVRRRGIQYVRNKLDPNRNQRQKGRKRK